MLRFRLPRAFFLISWLAAFCGAGFAQDLGGDSTISAAATVLDRLGFQMYSARNFPPLETQLSTLGELGYRYIEFSPLAEDPAIMRPLMEQNHLRALTGHFDLAALRADLPAAIDRAKAFGIATMVVSWLPPDQRPADAVGWTALGEEVEHLAEAAEAAGLALAWHTHDFEFAPLPDGSRPLDRLFAAAPHLGWQPDIGWIVRAGEDPVAWLQRYRARIRTAHLKDVAAPGISTEGGWADIGYGIVPWDKVLPLLAETEAMPLLVEHDEPDDYIRFASRSRESLIAWSRPR